MPLFEPGPGYTGTILNMTKLRLCVELFCGKVLHKCTSKTGFPNLN